MTQPSRTLARAVAASACVLASAAAPASPAGAQVRVHPTGVNVNAHGPTTVFLTYGGTRGLVAVEAFWCGELVPAAPARGFRCAPNTIYGRLPLRYDLSRPSAGVGTSANALTDVMSIPASVARRAYQDAARGARSSFFYVRRFVNVDGGADEYVAVTCRMAGGGARVPFALTDVTVAFDVETPVLFVEPGRTPPPLRADIAYNGTGRLKGRWEVVLPGEDYPTATDLLTEATLPPEERGSQRRFTQLERFNVFLPPTGRATLPGPDVSRIPTSAEGTYLILLRIEASDDKEGDSDLAAAGAGTGVVHSGAVAGFPMPALRYVVGAGSSDLSPRRSSRTSRALRALLPAPNATVVADSGLGVSWLEEWNAALYRIDFEKDDGTALLSAVVPPGVGVYRAPPFVAAAGGGSLRWRVVALDFDGWEMRRSGWRTVKIATPPAAAPDSAAAPSPPARP